VAEGAWGACCGADADSNVSTCKLIGAAPTTIPNTGVETKIALVTPSIEKGPALSLDAANSQINVLIAGVYIISILAATTPVGAGAVMRIRAAINAAPVEGFAFNTTSALPENGASQTLELAVGQTISAIAEQSGGTGSGAVDGAMLSVSGPFPAT
jgi:hypothetical protein